MLPDSESQFGPQNQRVLNGGRRNGFGFQAVSGRNTAAQNGLRTGCAERCVPTIISIPPEIARETPCLRDPPLRAAKQNSQRCLLAGAQLAPSRIFSPSVSPSVQKEKQPPCLACGACAKVHRKP